MMKKLLKKFETAMAAIAFAEEGQFETARQLMDEDKPETKTRPRKKDRRSIHEQI